MSFMTDIRAAMEAEIANVVGVPAATQRAWENVVFTPTTGTTWIRTSIVPFQSRPAVRGPTPQIKHGGILTIDIFTPEGNGSAEAEALADAVRSRYNVDSKLTSGSATVRFWYSERGQGLADSPWYHVPVIAEWYCYE